MDNQISTGDLVMVVRDCCSGWLGTTFRVSAVSSIALPAWLRCDKCKKEYSNIAYAVAEAPRALLNAPIFWLKKIDPPALPETVDEREEMTA